MKDAISLKAELETVDKQWDDLFATRKEDPSQEEHDAWYSKFTDLKGKREGLKRDIEIAEEKEKFEATKARDHAAAMGRRKTDEEKAYGAYSVVRATQMAAEKRKFEGVEKEVHEENMRNAPSDFNPSGIALPQELMRIVPKGDQPDLEKRAYFKTTRDLNVTTPGDGGYTVPTNLQEFIPVLMPDPVVRNLGATIISGLTGNIDFPKGTNRATATWEGEVDPAAETSLTFDLMQMRPKRLSAYTIASKQLLIQSSIGMENYQRQKLSESVAEALDIASFNGATGGDNPVGLENISGVGAITTSGIANVDEAKAYEFKNSLANSYALKGNLAWLVTNTADSTFRQKDLATDIGIRLLGGVAGQQNNKMINYETITSDLLAADSMIFGNWSELILAQWGALDLQVNPYSLDTTAQIRIVIDSWWDVNVRHAASFAMASDLS